MEEKTNTLHSKKDMFIWMLIFVLLTSGIVANSYFVELIGALRFTLWVFLVGVIIGLAALTVRGKKLWTFSKEARMELRKVVWPSRDETVKTTAIVAVLVFIMSIVLWLVDSALLWLVGWFTK